MLVKVTGTNFVRDTDSMALINTDIKEKNDYLSKVKMINTQKEELSRVNKEINSIKDDMNDIKQMMKQLLEKG
jgi:septal ring factor EnvC (AmiA/AmiB activator)